MKNKKILAILLSLGMMFNSTACNATTKTSTGQTKTTVTQQKQEEVKIPKENNKLTEQQVFDKLKKSLENLKSVTANYKVKVSQLDSAGKETGKGNNVDITSKIIYSDKKDKDGFKTVAKMYDETNIDGVKTKAYVDMIKNKIYLDSDQKGLKEYTGQDMKPQTESSYIGMVKAFSLSTNLSQDKRFKMTETDTTYDFTYKGKNGDLFYMVDGLFGLGIELNKLDDVEVNLTYKISKKDFSIIEVTHEVKQTVDNINYKSIGQFKLLSINDIKEIEEAKDLK
ncbi:hypothetical protein HMPREF9629_02207 [Peptoanaerobacter stomatis]|uniref:Lipoprotein n=1 Tax=Peptoanaerobacter stomatis TaxID=796937 RepID=G9X1G3_9FIRM|nr:hypothetical protein [Peptoanaerobacter stomatis]EHL14356.1 hypothetical protein HMPREF9629_02207 [Peptoanaerobacter stomatis]